MKFKTLSDSEPKHVNIVLDAVYPS